MVRQLLNHIVPGQVTRGSLPVLSAHGCILPRTRTRTYTLFLSGHINMTFEALTYKTVSRGIITYIKHKK